jgi:hypothetical protein
MTDTRAKADHFYNNLRQEEQGVDQLYFKGMEAIDKEYGGATDDPGYNARIGALNRGRQKLRTDIHEKYAGWATQAGVPFKPGQPAPAGVSNIGPPPGTDPNFDRAKAAIDAMPPGQVKDSKMKQLTDRWQSLQGKK